MISRGSGKGSGDQIGRFPRLLRYLALSSGFRSIDRSPENTIRCSPFDGNRARHPGTLGPASWPQQAIDLVFSLRFLFAGSPKARG